MLLLALIGCERATPWWEELQADSPCYEVDLKDGLDTDNTAELHALYGCVNRNGHFEALRPLDAALDEQGLGREVASWANGMTSADADPLFLLTTAIDLVASGDQDADAWFDLMLEVGWGLPATEVRAGIDLNAGVEGGVLAPLVPGVQRLAEELGTDDPLGVLPWVGRVLPGADRWVRTTAGWQTSTDPRVAPIVNGLFAELGVAVVATQSPGNDRWVASSGDSLRDLTEHAIDTDLARRIAPPLERLLTDPRARDGIEQVLVDLHGTGELQQLLPQLERLVAVNAAGQPVQGSQDSAFRSFLRLVAEGNEPLVCTVDLGLFQTHLSFGNLSVSVLDLMAELDPDAAQGATGLLADLLGFGFTEFLIEQLAQGGTCPPLDPQLIDDLRAVEAMQAPETHAVFVALVRVLKAAKDGEQNRIPDLVDLVSELEATGMVLPAEELIRDVGPTPFAAEVVELVPVLANPAAYGVLTPGEQPVDLEEMLLAVTALTEVDQGSTGLERLLRLLEPAVEEPGTWTALHRAAALLADPASRLSRVLEMAPPLVAADPELRLLQVAHTLFEVDEVRDPLLQIMATPSALDTLLATEPAEGQSLTPLGFIGARIIDGAATDLVRTLQRIRESL